MELYWRYAPGGALVEEIETQHLFVNDQRVLLVDDVIETNNVALGTGVLLRYQYGNHLGSVALELDEEAQIIGCEEFHPYGTTAYHLVNRAARATAKRYRYTGMERDEETDLSYHKARYYVPWLGRWSSADPTELAGGFNFYQYAAARPCSRVDLSGRQPTPPWREHVRGRDHPETMLMDSAAGTNWDIARNTLLEEIYAQGSAEANMAAFHRHLDKLAELYEGSLGSNSQRDSAIGYARSLFGRVRERFYQREAMHPSFRYAPEELERMEDGRAPAAGVQLDHGIVREEELAVNPYRALDATGLAFQFGHARGSGTHARATLARELHASGEENPGRTATVRLGDVFVMVDLSALLATSSSGTGSGGSGGSTHPADLSDEELAAESARRRAARGGGVRVRVDVEIPPEAEGDFDLEEEGEAEAEEERARYRDPLMMYGPDGQPQVFVLPLVVGVPFAILGSLLEVFGMAEVGVGTEGVLLGGSI